MRADSALPSSFRYLKQHGAGRRGRRIQPYGTADSAGPVLQRLWNRTTAVLDAAWLMMGDPPGELTIGGQQRILGPRSDIELPVNGRVTDGRPTRRTATELYHARIRRRSVDHARPCAATRAGHWRVCCARVTQLAMAGPAPEASVIEAVERAAIRAVPLIVLPHESPRAATTRTRAAVRARSHRTHSATRDCSRRPIARYSPPRGHPPSGSDYSSRDSPIGSSRRDVDAPSTEAPPRGPRRGTLLVRLERNVAIATSSSSTSPNCASAAPPTTSRSSASIPRRRSSSARSAIPAPNGTTAPNGSTTTSAVARRRACNP